LDDLGLEAAIEWQAKDFQSRTGIKCEIFLDSEIDILDKESSTAIFRILQETLTNVARHAKATNVNISMREEGEEIVLEVRDNGKGITARQSSHPKSFGLMGIRERAQVLGGKVEIHGIQGKGTTVTVRIPIRKE
jgi:signal transduction histidine kinase